MNKLGLRGISAGVSFSHLYPSHSPIASLTTLSHLLSQMSPQSPDGVACKTKASSFSGRFTAASWFPSLFLDQTMSLLVRRCVCACVSVGFLWLWVWNNKFLHQIIWGWIVRGWFCVFKEKWDSISNNIFAAAEKMLSVCMWVVVFMEVWLCVFHIKKISISRSNNVCQCSQCVYVCACVCLRGVRVCACVSLHVGIHYRAPEFFPL